MIKELKNVIIEILKERLAITEHELTSMLVTSENIEEVNDIKAACFSLEMEQKIGILTDSDGGHVYISVDENYYH